MVKKSVIAAVVLLSLAGLLHLVRLLMGWHLVIGTFEAPRWLSGIVVVFVVGVVWWLLSE